LAIIFTFDYIPAPPEKWVLCISCVELICNLQLVGPRNARRSLEPGDIRQLWSGWWKNEKNMCL